MPINSDNMFFSVAQWALEALCACTYEDLTALGQEEEVEEAPDGNEPTLGAQLSYKGAMKRFGKRCLAFVGNKDARVLMLVWQAVGERLMVVHYRFSSIVLGTRTARQTGRGLRCLTFAPALGANCEPLQPLRR